MIYYGSTMMCHTNNYKKHYKTLQKKLQKTLQKKNYKTLQKKTTKNITKKTTKRLQKWLQKQVLYSPPHILSGSKQNGQNLVGIGWNGQNKFWVKAQPNFPFTQNILTKFQLNSNHSAQICPNPKKHQKVTGINSLQIMLYIILIRFLSWIWTYWVISHLIMWHIAFLVKYSVIDDLNWIFELNLNMLGA